MPTEIHQFPRGLLIILVTARIFAELAARMGSMSVMGGLVVPFGGLRVAHYGFGLSPPVALFTPPQD